MNLQIIPRSAIFTPLLTRHGLAPPILARCVNEQLTINGGGRTYTCSNGVREGEGYADLEGTPFKAYYCPACAVALGAESPVQVDDSATVVA